ncbi:MAG TPA: ABC transporter permease [Cyanobacteria bacterium UBA11369]|nr:ABC transporter permease [Cyanobacteria bacterium UBA11371]HBE31953.1 ABC transporter permease [Cyanobacteria bacterium UBA11368]HBE47797.1 ABC transporter permease [Cyanobacteria bacterium UBA11369]
MDILESVKMAATTLTANKLRSSLTMLGIIIGNASVIAMVGIGQGAQRLASEQFESLGPNVLFILPGNQNAQRNRDLPRTLVLEDAQAIARQVPSVSEVAPQIQSQQTVVYRNKNTNTQIFGVTPEFLTVRSFDVAKGRFISNEDLKSNNEVVLLGSDVVKKMFGNSDPIGERIRIRNLSFTVIGVMQPKGSFLGSNQDDAVYIPLTTMANRLRGRTSPYGLLVDFIAVSAKDTKSIGAAQFQISNLLRLRHKITNQDDFTIRTQRDVLTIVGTITNGLTLMLAAIAGISLLVGGIGVMNIMLVSVTERTHEIGLRKAIGATEQDILIQFMIEAIILSAVGGAIGTLIGVGGVTLVSVFSPLKAGISPAAILVATGVSGGIGLFFGVVPARRAAKLDPIVALRSA